MNLATQAVGAGSSSYNTIAEAAVPETSCVEELLHLLAGAASSPFGLYTRLRPWALR